MSQAHTILLVDDEDGIRKAIRKSLRFEPYEVLETGDPNEAIKMVQNLPIHLVLSDHLMPGMLGMDLLRRVRLTKPDVIRIILTGHADLDMAMQAINEGAIYRFLTKPWDNNELLLAIRLGIRTYETEEQNRKLVRLVKKHEVVLARLEGQQPGITGLSRRTDGSLVLGDEDLERALRDLGADAEELEDEKTQELPA